MVNLNEQLIDQNQRMKQMVRTANETDQISNNVMNELGKQGEKLKTNIDLVLCYVSIEQRNQRRNPTSWQKDQCNETTKHLYEVVDVHRGNHSLHWHHCHNHFQA
jgi:hypothetical protein